MNVTTVTDAPASIHQDGSMGLIHLDERYRGAEDHPEIKKYKPMSKYGEVYLAKFDNSDYFAWTKPVSGGYYRSCDPVFLIEA